MVPTSGASPPPPPCEPDCVPNSKFWTSTLPPLSPPIHSVVSAVVLITPMNSVSVFEVTVTC